MNKLFRVCWFLKIDPKTKHSGPTLYLTTRDVDFKKLRAYTKEEGEKAVKYCNEHYTRGLHILEEVS